MSGAISFNVWRTSSKEQQERLLDAMRAEAPDLQSKRGFLELTAWKGDADDLRVLVEGRRESVAAFETAVANSPAALKSRERLAQLGTPEAGLFRQAFSFQANSQIKETSSRTLPSGIVERDIEVNGQTIVSVRPTRPGTCRRHC